MKWHPLFINWCLYLRHLSGKSYDLLWTSGCVKLPSQSTLRDYIHHIPATIGFSAEVDQHIYDVAFLSKELNRYVILVMDEMYIKHDLVYDIHNGSLIISGFVDLGSINNQLLEFENALAAEKTESKLASTMLTFMVRVFCVNSTILMHSLPVVMSLVVKCLMQCGKLLEGWRGQVSVFLELPVMELHQIDGYGNYMVVKMSLYKVPNIFADDNRDLYFISDPPHLLKTIRNSFCNPSKTLWVRILYL